MCWAPYPMSAEGSVLGSLSMSTEEGSVLGSLSHVHRRRQCVGLLIPCPQKKVVCWAPYRGFPTRMVYLYYKSCLRYTILAGNPRYPCPQKKVVCWAPYPCPQKKVVCWAPYPMSTEEGSVLGSLYMSTEGSVLGSLSMSTEEGSVLGSLSHVHRR